jgi:hypothetical protein
VIQRFRTTVGKNQKWRRCEQLGIVDRLDLAASMRRSATAAAGR